MEKLLKQLRFDELALSYLNKIDALTNSANLEKVRVLFKSIDELIDAIIRIDEVRKINGSEVENIRKIRRYKKTA